MYANELERLHEIEKQYPCQYCPNRFRKGGELERHQNSLHLRKYSWSCASMSAIEAAFRSYHTPAAQTSNNTATDVCVYCGENFPNYPQQDWEARLEHLTNAHKIGQCNQSKKFYRVDHFRQHLKHSHAGRCGKWTIMLENACMKDERPDLETLSQVSNHQFNCNFPAMTYARDQQFEAHEQLLEYERPDRLPEDAATTWPHQTPIGGNDSCSDVLLGKTQVESPSEIPKTSQHNVCSDVSAQGPGSSERSLGNIKDVGNWEWLQNHEELRRSVDALGDLEVFENCGVLPEVLPLSGNCELSPAMLCKAPRKVLDWLAAQNVRSNILTDVPPADGVHASDGKSECLRGTGISTVTCPSEAEMDSMRRENEILKLKVKVLEMENTARRAAMDGSYRPMSPLPDELIDFNMFVLSNPTSPADQTFTNAAESVPNNSKSGVSGRRTHAQHDLSSGVISSKEFISDASSVPKESLRVVTSSKSDDSLIASSIKSRESWKFSTVTGMLATP